MKIKNRLIIVLILLAVFGFMTHRAYNWSLDHYEYMTTGEITDQKKVNTEAFECFSCHAYMQNEGFFMDLASKEYVSPYNLTVSSDNRLLFITGQESDALLMVDFSDNEKVVKLKTGEYPHSVVVTSDTRKAYVSNQWSNTISVIDVDQLKVTDTIETGGGPAGIVLDRDEKFLYVANTFTSDISVIDLSEQREVKRLHAGNYPTGISLSPNGRHVAVVSQRSVLTEYREPPKTEVTLIDTNPQRVTERKYFEEAHIMESADFTPEGDLAFTTLVRPKNLVPAVQVENGWMMNYALGVMSFKSGKMYQLPLDEPNAFYADPYYVRITPDGRQAFISHSGGDYISVLDIEMVRNVIQQIDAGDIVNPENDLTLSRSYVIKRIATGSNPKGMALSPDGRFLYVAERLTDRIGIINTESLILERHIELGDQDQTAFLRKGEQLFNNASHTFQSQYSCYSCHPDNHEDGLTYDMAYYPGTDLSNVQTLRELSNTSPFKWNGKNVSVYMQCGMRFSKFVTRTEVFSPEDLKALVGYITGKIEHPPNMYRDESGDLTEAQLRGKEIFGRTRTNDGSLIAERDRCITCHPGPNFTDRRMHDVGTATERDSHQEFDSPNLNNIYQSAPYLHDGRANTLEELWTLYNDDDEHGVANDMTKDQLNDLIEYLLSLESAKHYK